MIHSSDHQIVRFSRFKVKDISAFRAIHEKALKAQAAYGLEERVFQSVDDSCELTVQISGASSDVRRWLESAERSELARHLELEGDSQTWEATELE